MDLSSVQLNAIDMAFLIVVIWETVLGIKRGFTKELPRFLGTAIVFLTSLWGYRIVGSWLIAHTRLSEQQELSYAISYIVIAVLVAACIIILRTLISLLLTIKFNDSIEKPFGGTAGFLRALLISLHLIFMAGLLPNEEIRTSVDTSMAGRATFKAVPFMLEKLGWIKDKNVVPAQGKVESKQKRSKKASDKLDFLESKE